MDAAIGKLIEQGLLGVLLAIALVAIIWLFRDSRAKDDKYQDKIEGLHQQSRTEAIETTRQLYASIATIDTALRALGRER